MPWAMCQQPAAFIAERAHDGRGLRSPSGLSTCPGLWGRPSQVLSPFRQTTLRPRPAPFPQVMVLDDETHFKRVCTQLAACAGQQANETELKVNAGPARQPVQHVPPCAVGSSQCPLHANGQLPAKYCCLLAAGKPPRKLEQRRRQTAPKRDGPVPRALGAPSPVFSHALLLCPPEQCPPLSRCGWCWASAAPGATGCGAAYARCWSSGGTSRSSSRTPRPTANPSSEPACPASGHARRHVPRPAVSRRAEMVRPSRVSRGRPCWWPSYRPRQQARPPTCCAVWSTAG